jgi:hypothetical protein
MRKQAKNADGTPTHTMIGPRNRGMRSFGEQTSFAGRRRADRRFDRTVSMMDWVIVFLFAVPSLWFLGKLFHAW